MDLFPKNVGNVYTNEHSAHVSVCTVTVGVCYQARLIITAFSGFRSAGAFRVCLKFLWTADEILCWFRLVEGDLQTVDCGLRLFVSQWTATVCESVDCDCL